MKNLHGPALATFNSGCTFLAIYMAIKQINTYLENADTSAVSFQRFTDGPIDRYPTYTFCLEDSNRGDIYVSKESAPKEVSDYPIGGDTGFHVKMEGQKLLVVKGERPWNATLNGNGLNLAMDDSQTNGLEGNEPTATKGGPQDTQKNSLNLNSLPPIGMRNINLQIDKSSEEFNDYDTPTMYLGGSFLGMQHVDHSETQKTEPIHIINNKNEEIDPKAPPKTLLGMHLGMPQGRPMLGSHQRKKRSLGVDTVSPNSKFAPPMPDETESKEKLDCNKSDSNVRIYHPQGHDNLIFFSKEGKFYSIRRDHYQALLMGTDISFMFQPNDLADCKDVKYSIEDVSKIVFSENTIDLNSFLLDFHIKTINGSILGWINDTYAKIENVCILRQILGDKPCATEDSFKARLRSRIRVLHPIKKVYQDPRRLCYSPVLYPGLHRQSDHITLELKSMISDWLLSLTDGVNPIITMHVHMQGQFLRSLGKEIASLTAQDLITYCPEHSGNYNGDCHGTRLTFDISQVTLLKNRHDATKSCNDNLKDEDKHIISTILKENNIQCVPDFWYGLLNNTNFDYPKCNTQRSYKNIGMLTSNFTSNELLRKMFKPPCEEMIIVTNVQKTKGRKLRKKPLIEPQIDQTAEDVEMLYLDMKIRHVNDRYQVITNFKGFTGEGCWSAIGGFVGIFVGLSLMQLPEVILGLYHLLFKTRKTLDKENINTKF